MAWVGTPPAPLGLVVSTGPPPAWSPSARRDALADASVKRLEVGAGDDGRAARIRGVGVRGLVVGVAEGPIAAGAAGHVAERGPAAELVALGRRAVGIGGDDRGGAAAARAAMSCSGGGRGIPSAEVAGPHLPVQSFLCCGRWASRTHATQPFAHPMSLRNGGQPLCGRKPVDRDTPATAQRQARRAPALPYRCRTYLPGASSTTA